MQHGTKYQLSAWLPWLSDPLSESVMFLWRSVQRSFTMSFTGIAYLVDDKWIRMNMAAGGIIYKLIQNVVNYNPIPSPFRHF
jgi:hypothetical protein